MDKRQNQKVRKRTGKSWRKLRFEVRVRVGMSVVKVKKEYMPRVSKLV